MSTWAISRWLYAAAVLSKSLPCIKETIPQYPVFPFQSRNIGWRWLVVRKSLESTRLGLPEAWEYGAQYSIDISENKREDTAAFWTVPLWVFVTSSMISRINLVMNSNHRSAWLEAHRLSQAADYESGVHKQIRPLHALLHRQWCFCPRFGAEIP